MQLFLTHTCLEPFSARPRARQRPQPSSSGQAPWFLHSARDTRERMGMEAKRETSTSLTYLAVVVHTASLERKYLKYVCTAYVHSLPGTTRNHSACRHGPVHFSQWQTCLLFVQIAPSPTPAPTQWSRPSSGAKCFQAMLHFGQNSMTR